MFIGSALDDHYYEIAKSTDLLFSGATVLTARVAFGQDNANLAYESHQWALEHVGEVSKGLNISCEYRTLPGYTIVDVPETETSYKKRNNLPEEVEAVKRIGYGSKVSYEPRGNMGNVYKGGVIKWQGQATFHPTK